MLQVMDSNSFSYFKKKITENTLLKLFFAKKTVFKDVQERQQAQHGTKGEGNVDFQCKTLAQHN